MRHVTRVFGKTIILPPVIRNHVRKCDRRGRKDL